MRQNLFDLRGRVALVTGGSRGLGLAMARALAGAGADVVIAARNADGLKAAAADLPAAPGARTGWRAVDMGDRAAVGRMAADVVREFGKVDVLVNNAAVNAHTTLDEVRDQDWDTIVGADLTGPMVLCRALAPQMKANRWGRIIFIGSIFGEVGRPGRIAYSAAKAGLHGLAAVMAVELAPYGVTVNLILPGPFETPMTAGLHKTPAARQWFTDRIPMGRWGRPEEMAGPVLLLASEAGSFITGASLAVDGGWMAQ
jgi:NAD(P)-dependent dehydrogenase (short-subunit alcohol dehydrogenase family)